MKHRLKIKLRNNIINKKINITTLNYNLRNTLKILIINLYKKIQQELIFHIKLRIFKMKLNNKMIHIYRIHKLINNLINMKIKMTKNNKQNQSKKLKHKLIIYNSKLLMKVNQKFNLNKMQSNLIHKLIILLFNKKIKTKIKHKFKINLRILIVNLIKK